MAKPSRLSTTSEGDLAVVRFANVRCKKLYIGQERGERWDFPYDYKSRFVGNP